MIWEDERLEQEEKKRKQRARKIYELFLCVLIGIGLAFIGYKLYDYSQIYKTTKPVVEGVATREDSAVYWQQKIKEDYDINIVLDATDEKHEFNFKSLSPYHKTIIDDEEVRTRDVAIKQLYSILGNYNEKALDKLKGIYIYVCQDIYQEKSLLQGLTVKPLLFPDRIYISAEGYSEERFSLIVNHELFHALTDKIPDWWLEEYEMIDESCKTISDYACTSIDEELPDAWAYGLNGLETKKTAQVLKRYKALYLE